MTAEFNVGQRIGDYEILSVLGLGGMGKVYKVRNTISDRVEAMKVLLPDLTSHQSLGDRFLREIRLLASLNHPNIAALRTAMSYENQLVMIMEFVEGETLANRLARAPISTADAVNYSDQILSALAYAHKMNIIHRDIKPANMMLTPQGVVKLMDFGIARSGTDGTLTSTGTTLGSLNYMPPEQVRGESADARSDIYSFGISLYELLTGKLPFQGDSQYSLMTAHLNQEPAPPITMRSDLPPALNEIILMAMAKDPAQRFQTADAFRAALKSVPVSALPHAGTTFTPTPRTPTASEVTLVDTVTPSVSMPAMASYTPPKPAPPVQTPVFPPTMATPAPTPTMAVPTPAPTTVAPRGGTSSPPYSQQPPAKSNRGLWLAIGSLIGAGVLIAGGIYIPKHLKTHADPNESTFSDNNKGTASGKTDAKKGVNVDAGGASVHVDDNGNVSIKGGGTSIETSADGKVKINAGGTSVDTGAGQVKTDGNPKPWRDSHQPDTITPPPPPPSGPSQEDLDKLEDEADKLNVRASTASQSIETLRRQQQAEGYNLRADISSAAERMKLYLAKGDAALKAKDTANAQKYFDLADTEISKVEKFLGH